MRHDIEQEGLYINGKGDFKTIEQIREDNIQKVNIEFAKPKTKVSQNGLRR
jgi:hypothetical protein